MKKIKWKIILGLLLIGLSAIAYFIHYLIFYDAHHVFIYLLGDIAFVPIEVLLVTLIIHKLLEVREKRSILDKLNMVIGVFFSEVGTQLLEYYPRFNSKAADLADNFLITKHWSEKDFKKAKQAVKSVVVRNQNTSEALKDLKEFVITKRSFLLSLLENPNLLEHENFTDLLWAVFHMTEELSYRKNIENLSEKDYEHISGDVKRAYEYLVREWLDYMFHLKKSYPYLFSLALRTNPFDKDACVEIS